MKKPAGKIGAAILAVALLFTLTPGQAPLTARAASENGKNTETGRQIVQGIEVPEGTLGNFSVEKDFDILSKDGFLPGGAVPRGASDTSLSAGTLQHGLRL